MKLSEVKVGGFYIFRVRSKTYGVFMLEVIETNVIGGRHITNISGINVTTNRRCSIGTAARLHREATKEEIELVRNKQPLNYKGMATGLSDTNKVRQISRLVRQWLDSKAPINETYETMLDIGAVLDIKPSIKTKTNPPRPRKRSMMDIRIMESSKYTVPFTPYPAEFIKPISIGPCYSEEEWEKKRAKHQQWLEEWDQRLKEWEEKRIKHQQWLKEKNLDEDNETRELGTEADPDDGWGYMENDE